MRVLTALTMIVALAMPATAMDMKRNREVQAQQDQELAEKVAEADRAYREMKRNTRTASPQDTAKVDPWGSFRAADPAPVPARKKVP